MSIIKLIWKTIILLICSIIQLIGVLVEGMAKILSRTAKILEKAHDRVLDLGSKKKEEKKAHIHVPL